MKNPNLSPESDNELKIEPIETDNGEMFDMEALYAPSDFLRILRIIYNRHLDDKSLVPMIQALEVWEKRVIDFVNGYDGAQDDVQIGFHTAQDQLTRIYFTFKTNKR